MTNNIIIRKDVFSLIKQLSVIEITFFVLFFLINFFIVYEELENKSPLNYIIDTDVATLLLFIFISTLIIILAFIHWYLRSSISITSSSILYRRGLFLRMDVIDFQDIKSVSYKPSILGEYLHFGSIILTKKSNNKILRFDYITNAEYYINIIKKSIEHNNIDRPLSNEQVLEVIQKGESNSVEFKQTFRKDVKLNKVNKELEKAVMKTIVGFVNSKGGFLFIGVTDEGNITGLEEDYKTLKRSTRDYFENYLLQIFDSMIGREFVNLISIDFYNIEGKDICLIRMLPSVEPVYLKFNNSEIFYTRIENSTKSLNVREANKYIQLNFG